MKANSFFIPVAISSSSSTLSFFACAQNPKTIVVGSGPGGTGFIKRAIQHASCEDNFEWFEEGGDDVVLDWPGGYNTPGSERYIKLIDRKAGQVGESLKAIRFTAFGGGAVMNSGSPLTLMDSDDERIQSAVDQHGFSFLAEELQSQSRVVDEASDRLIEWYNDAGYEVESNFLTTRKAGQGNRVGYGASTILSGGTRTQIAKTLVNDNPNRINLHLQTRVKRVIFGPARNAIGIELMNGTMVKGDRVVLAGGVFGTYELLVRSGIGSKEDLETVGVDEIVTDESVGKNIGDDSGIAFFHGDDGRETHASDGTWQPGVVASRGNQFGITHWGKIVFDLFLLETDYRTSNSSAYDFLRPVAENTSVTKIDLPATYDSSVAIQDDGTLAYDDSKNYREEICVNEAEFGVLNRTSAPDPLITGLAALIGMAHSTPDKQCSSGLLFSNYHYHGGSQGVTNSDFSVKGTQKLYISDASVTDKFSFGAPTTNVYMIGYAAADAVYHATSSVPLPHSGSLQHYLKTSWVMFFAVPLWHFL